MIICSHCGNSVGDNLRFCTECGTETPGFAGQSKRSPALEKTIPYGAPVRPTIAQQQQPTEPVYFAPAATIRPAAPAPSGRKIVWILIPIGLLALVVIAVVGVRLAISTNNARNNGNANLKTATPSPSPTAPNGHFVSCKFNGVHIRNAPDLNAGIITDIQLGHSVLVIRESANTDTVTIRSRGQAVTDNWSEVQVENTPVGSVRGWIFSGFLR